MAKIDENSIAKLKALFQDNEKALGSNFSQLIDFFNDNKVTDNGDGTFSVGAITVDASKLYNLINNSSPNILPLDTEFTGKNTFDIAPINKANGKPYITADSVPPVDLSNYPTKDQLATKADTSAIDQSVLLGAIPITSTTDLFTLDPGIYFGNNVVPVNGPAINSLPTTNFFWVKLETPKANPLIKELTWTDNGYHQYTNQYYGISAKWHD